MDHTSTGRQPALDDLVEAEQDVRARLGHLPLDFEAMALVSNLHRAANAVRRHMEVQVLGAVQLSWTAFLVLWVLWIWGEMETRHLAAEANVTKGTLSGVVDTLQRRGLVQRRRHEGDRRQVSVALTAEGEALISEVFPRFNAQERVIADLLTDADRDAAVHALRHLVAALSTDGTPPADHPA